MKSNDLLYAEPGSLTTEQLKTFSTEELSLWLTQPTRKEITGVTWWMQTRVTLLVIAIIYYRFESNYWDVVFEFLVVIGSYEFAYYKLRKEKVDREYQLAMMDYYTNVRKLRG